MLIAIGLTIQVIALVVLFQRLGRTWLTHIGAIFIVIAVLYHGVTEVFLWMFPGYDIYRSWVSADYVGQFVVWISVAILMCTLTYIWVLGRQDAAERPHASASEVLSITRFFDWRLMLVVAIPLVALSVNGQGYLSNGDPQATSGVAVEYWYRPAIPSVRHRARSCRIDGSFRSSIRSADNCGKCGVVALLGQRAVIVWTVALTLYALARLGIRISKWGAVAGVADTGGVWISDYIR